MTGVDNGAHPERIPLEGCTIEPSDTNPDFSVIRYPDGAEIVRPNNRQIAKHGVELPQRFVEITAKVTVAQRNELALLDPYIVDDAFEPFIRAAIASQAAEK